MKKKRKHLTQSKINNHVQSLLEDINARILSDFLRDMLVDYLLFNKDALPVHFDVSLNQLAVLFKVLDRL